MISEDRIEVKDGGGLSALFGCLFLLLGLGFLTGSVFPFLFGSNVQVPPAAFRVPFGCIFTIVGVCGVFGRKKKIVDKIQGTFTKQWSLIVPLRNVVYELSDFSHIQVTQEVRNREKSPYNVYPVYLQGRVTQEKLIESRNYRKSRQLSEQLSKVLDYDIFDQSSGTKVIRKAGTMDQTVRDQILKSGETLDLPIKPENMKSDIYMVGDSLVVDIPPVGFSAWSLFGIFPLLIAVLFFSFFSFEAAGFERDPDGNGFNLTVLSILLILFSYPLIMAYKSVLAPLFVKSSIKLDRYELQYSLKGAAQKHVKMSCDDIEELFVSGGRHDKLPRGKESPSFEKKNAILCLGEGRGIFIRTDAKTLELGAHLDMVEQEYIVAEMRQILVS